MVEAHLMTVPRGSVAVNNGMSIRKCAGTGGNKDGKMVEIKRLDYFTDTQYYNSIMKLKIGLVIEHKNNSQEKIKNLIGYKNS